ncbi:AAA family ATPase [Priestia megaterium]|uniref:AAA family ATPase n=1 Tax=Priestia megaterium TaxID=1404 RepID=UPI00366C7C37
MFNTFVYFSNTVGEYELFIRKNKFYWPRNIAKKTKFQQINGKVEQENVNDTIYIVSGLKIKDNIKYPFLKSKITSSPMLTHKGYVTKIIGRPILGYYFTPEAYRDHKNPSRNSYVIPMEALQDLKELDTYLGENLTHGDKEEISVALKLYNIIEKLITENEIEFERCYEKDNTWYIENKKNNNFVILNNDLSEIRQLPPGVTGKRNYKMLPNKDSLKRIIDKCEVEGIDGRSLVQKLHTWQGKEFVEVKITDSLFYPLVDVRLSEGISTRQITSKDYSDELINQVRKVYLPKEGIRETKTEVLKMNTKNLILYGPPGTGKTYNVALKAIEIIDPQRYKDLIEGETAREEIMNEYKKYIEKKQIAFCTFHQSFSYEDFVEGLRSDEEGRFVPTSGVFRTLCEAAELAEDQSISSYDFDVNSINFHKMSLGNSLVGDDDIYEYCIENNVVALGWGREIDYSDCSDRKEVKKKFLNSDPDNEERSFNIDAINRFKNWIQIGDIILISQGNHRVRAIAKVIGEYYYEPNSEISYNHFRKVEWLYHGEPIGVEQFLSNKVLSQQAIYKFLREDINTENIRSILSSKQQSSFQEDIQNFVLIIDEINRGNISKIFGELITLIEEDKRKGELNEISLILPYSKKRFSVPKNVFIIGTMNTADRSIALMDTALRRRFNFIECAPDASLLPEDVEGVNVSKFLRALNERINFLYDQDHLIGHAYFMKPDLTFKDLISIMKFKVLPLLQDYFYEDWEKIEMVLGGAGEFGDSSFFLNKSEKDPSKIFGNLLGRDFDKQYQYHVVDNPIKEAFIRLYVDLDS